MTETVTTTNQAGESSRGRRTLLLLVVIFAAPVLAAWFYWFNPELLPSTRSNKGEILNPPVELPTDLKLTTPAGNAFQLELLRDRWVMLYLERGQCDERCVDQLMALRQIRLALGEGMVNVERLFVLAEPNQGNNPPLDQAMLDRAFEGMSVALADADASAALAGVLDQAAAPDADGGDSVASTAASDAATGAALGSATNDAFGRIYFIDPRGRIMMRYAPDAPPEDPLSDMERLLKASKNWIKGKSYGHN